ncbi:MAG: efflux RND transporter permease subunit [Gemmatimonadetes bacterium]|nr:efflux RND transporter permease subunit [Gemmatimonadota bacterium]
MRHRISVFSLCVLIVIAGVSSYLAIPKESSPSITIPIIVVSVIYPGVSPNDMESLVTKKMESKLDEIRSVRELRSTTAEGYTAIEVEFEPSMEIESALQRVRDKVNQAKVEIPADAEEPIISEINFDDFPIIMLNLAGEYGLLRLKNVAEDLQEELEKIKGVLDVTISGDLEREVQIDVDPVRLRSYNLELYDIIETVRDENLTIPGGSIDGGTVGYSVRVPGEFEDPGVIGGLVVTSIGDRPVYIRDLADVRFGTKEPSTYARQNDLECITLSISKRSGENIIEIADAVKATLKAQEPKFPPTTEVTVVADQSKEIRDMVSDLENNILSGLLLVVFVLFAFLGFRNSLFVAIAIPFSMLLSFIVIGALDYTMNMVVLFSLILVLGMLVDNAIVIVENIYRHRVEGYTRLEAASKATNEVALPVIASTVTTLCAFGPLLFWPDVVGEFMKYIPITLIITLTSSLFVALVINPTFCAVLIQRPKKGEKRFTDPFMARSLSSYRKVLDWALGHRALTLGGVFLLLIATMMLYGVLGKGVEYFPDVEPNYAYIDVTAPLGTRLEVSDEIVRQIEKEIPRFPDIKHYVANVGSATDVFYGSSQGNSNQSRVTVEFVDRADRTQSSFHTIEQFREAFTKIPGARIDVEKPEQGPPGGAPVDVEILGEDFEVLGRLSKEIERKIKDVPGLVDLRSDFDEGKPEIRVRIDREKAALYGLSTASIASTIQTAIMGTEASKYRVGEDEYDITVRFRESDRDHFESLDELTVFYEGSHIPIANFCKFELSGGLGTIVRKNQDRVVSLTGDAAEGYLPNDILAEIGTLLEDYPLPTGYSVRFSGETEDQDEAAAFLGGAFRTALLLILLVLISQFNSVMLPLAILTSVVLSLIGVFVGLMVTQLPFGIIMTGVGVISLAGVVVNNAIVLIDYIQKLRQRGYPKLEAIVEAGQTRFRPVVLTAITTILGLIPLTTGFSFDFKTFRPITGSESSEWWGSMGVAVIFGLAVATFLTLVVVPVLYSTLTGISEWLTGLVRRDPDEPEEELILAGGDEADAQPPLT